MSHPPLLPRWGLGRDTKGSMEIQKEATKLLKVTTIVPYRPTSGPINKEIDDD